MSNNTNTNVGNNNSVLGSWALSSAANDTSCNSAFGTNSLLKHTTGSFNTSLGAGAMTFNITGSRNVAVGSSALEFNTNSENNTAIGTQALFGQREGSNNTAIGINAGFNDVSGSFNTYLGANTGPDSSLNTWTNSTAIGYGATISSSNQIVLGTEGQDVRIPGNLYLGNIQITGSGGGGGGSTTNLTSDQFENTYVGNNTTLMGGPGYGRSFQGVKNSTAIGYGSNITLSKQIVLGTSAEFVCIPSNRGLSIGKTTAPTTGIVLDVSGSLIVSGDMNVNGTYRADGLSNIKIGDITNKTLGLSVFRDVVGATQPVTSIKLNIINPEEDTSTFKIENTFDSSTNFISTLFITSTTGFDMTIFNNIPPTTPIDSSLNWSKNNSILDNSINTIPYYGSVYIGYSSDGKNLIFYLKNDITENELGPLINMDLFPFWKYKKSTSVQTIKLYVGLGTSKTGTSVVPTSTADYIYLRGGTKLQLVASTTISPKPIKIPSYSTYIGANIKYLSDVDTSTSTAIGYGANIDLSNQIVLGTSAEFVCIPSNRGLSIGKTMAPSSGVGLDVNGSIALNTGLMKYNKDLFNVSLFSNGFYNDTNYPGYNVNNGSANIAIGGLSLISYNNENNGLTSNIAIGGQSMMNTTNGIYNVSIGGQSMMNNKTGICNTSIGTISMKNQIDGSYNTSIGQASMEFGIRNNYNTSIGYGAGSNDISGSYNTYLGVNTGTDTSLNIYNKSTAIGYQATINESNQIVLGTTNERVDIPGRLFLKNVEITSSGGGGGGGGGTSTGANSDANNNTLLGTNSDRISASIEKSTAIGYNAKVDASNQIVLGTSGEFVCIPSNRGLSIGKTTAPTSGVGLDVSGAISINKGIINYSIAPINYSTGVIDIDLISYEMIFPNLNVSLFTNSELSVSDNLVPLLSGANLTNNMLYNLMLGFNQIGLNYDDTSMYDVKNGFCNVALGAKSLSKMTRNEPGSRASSYNTSIGSLSQMSSTIGSNNTTIGARSLIKKISGSNNVGVGFEAGWNDISGSYNTYLGSYTKIDNETNIYQTSTAIGYGATITNQNQIVLGTSNERVDIPGRLFLKNVEITGSGGGGGGISGLSDASSNLKLGTDSLSINTGSNNTAIGTSALASNTSSNDNTAIGYSALYANTGSKNTAIGSSALLSNFNSNYNTALGYQTLYANQGGTQNTAVGSQSLASVINGNYNTAIGHDSLYNTNGSNNTAIGRRSLYTSGNGDGYGNDNTAIGKDSLYNLKYGNNNTSLGSQIGSKCTQAGNCTFLGANTDFNSIRDDYGDITYIGNSTAIGYNAKLYVSNQIVLGTANEFVCIPSNIGLSIGKTTAPITNYALDVSGSVQATGYNATSDYRIKDNVRTLDEEDTISNLRPVKYFNKQTNKNDFGLIAHELQSEYPDLVSGEKDGADLQSVNYIGLISVLIKEVQDLKRITAEQAIEIAELKSSTYQPLEKVESKL